MNQSELEEKVRELFEQQGFDVEKEDNEFVARNGSELVLKAFSSEKHITEDIVPQIDGDDKVFVDEELSEIKEEIENDVSVLREEEDEEEYDTPSYEVIGDVAVINELASISREEAVEGILHHQGHVKTILLKDEGLSGEFRLGEYEKLYGEETETVHKEFGCRFKVDPTKVYFSERFSTERQRVVDQTEDGEKVLVMFAGVGPFAILAAKEANPEKVVAVEKNPEGAEYLKENIELNKVEDAVEGLQGDVEEVVPELDEKFDRIIMPLPGSADKFLDLAFEHSEDNGVIHYYRFLRDQNWEELEEEIEAISRDLKHDYSVESRTTCGNRGPNLDRVCVDIRTRQDVLTDQ